MFKLQRMACGCYIVVTCRRGHIGIEDSDFVLEFGCCDRHVRQAYEAIQELGEEEHGQFSMMFAPDGLPDDERQDIDDRIGEALGATAYALGSEKQKGATATPRSG